MTPKEKAEELVGKCFDTFINDEDEHYVGTAWKLSKQCALIAVDEILNSNPYTYIEKGGSDSRGDWSYKEAQSNKKYWEEVKQEIEKL